MDCKNLKDQMLKCVKDNDGTHRCKDIIEKLNKECGDLENKEKTSWVSSLFTIKEETEEDNK